MAWAIFGVIALVASVALYFAEWVEKTVDNGYTAEAVRQPYLAAEQFLEMASGLASLRAVRFVHDDGVVAVGEVAHFLGDERELLECGDDDRGAARQGVGQLLRVLLDADHDSGRVLELVDGVLELLVENQPVGDDDDGLEDLRVLVVVQA